jgi:hypothetical protein
VSEHPTGNNFVHIQFEHGNTVYSIVVPIANSAQADTSPENKKHLRANVDEAVKDCKSVILDRADLKGHGGRR